MLLAIATTAIAGPLSKQAKTKLLLAALQDDAEIEGWLSNIGNAVKEYGPGILKTGLKLASSYDEEELAAMEDDDDVPEIEGWLSSIGNAFKKYGPGILKTGLKLAKNFGDEQLKRKQAAMQDDDDAEIEGWLSNIGNTFKKYGQAF